MTTELRTLLADVSLFLAERHTGPGVAGLRARVDEAATAQDERMCVHPELDGPCTGCALADDVAGSDDCTACQRRTKNDPDRCQDCGWVESCCCGGRWDPAAPAVARTYGQPPATRVDTEDAVALVLAQHLGWVPTEPSVRQLAARVIDAVCVAAPADDTAATAAAPWTVTLCWTPDQNFGAVSVLQSRAPLHAIFGLLAAGEPVADVAAEWGLPASVVEVLARLRGELADDTAAPDGVLVAARAVVRYLAAARSTGDDSDWARLARVIDTLGAALDAAGGSSPASTDRDQ